MSAGYLDSAERVHRAGGSTAADRERPNPAAFEAAARTERDRGQTPSGDGGTRSGQGRSGQVYLDSAERVHRAGGSTAATAPPATAAPRPGEVPVSPARAARIDDWVAQRSDPHNDGFLWLDHHSGAEKVGDALTGRSELGALSADEQRYLMDGVLARWADGHGDGANGPGNLVRELPDEPGVRGIVAERTALRAGMLADRPPPQDEVERYLARTETAMYAQAAVEAVSGPAGRPPGDLAALRDMVGRLGPEGAAGLARALDPDPTGLTPPGSLPNGIEGPAGNNAELMGRTLAALNGGARTEATGAFVQNAFALATPNAYLLSSTPRPGALEPRGAEGVPDLRQEMATALAREWHPDAPEAAAAEAERLRGILDMPQGLDLLAARSDGPSLDARVNALATLRLHPEITADTLRATRDPWTNPAITGPAAQAQAQPFLARGDAAQVLRGSDLDNTVGVAMGRTPATPPGMTPEAAEAALARGEANFFHDDEAVGAVSDAIRRAGGEDARVTVLPVTYSSGATGPMRLPLFRVETAAGERFVDNQGRTYRDFEHWRTTNALPPGIVHYPEGGRLSAGPDGRVRLGQGNTPKTVDTWGERVGQVLDTAALVGGVVVTGLVIAGTGGTAVLVVGAGVAVWNGARGVQALQDRAEHGQSLSLADPQARGLWLGLAADTAAVGAFGSAARLAQLGRTGRAIAPLEASAQGYVQAGANLVDAAAIGNQGVDLVRNWDSMAPQDRAQAVLQMGFWGAASLAGARASGAGPGELFNPVAIRDSLLQTYPPPVTRDLPGDQVRIAFDPANGDVLAVQAGRQASQADIDLHMDLAQSIRRGQTLEARLEGLITGAGRGEPPPGTVGWAARIETQKLDGLMRDTARRLAAPGLDSAARSQLAARLEAYGARLDEQRAQIDSLARDPAQAFIAAPDGTVQPTGQQQAEALGLGDALDGRLRDMPEVDLGNYYLRYNPRGDAPEIVRVSTADGPQLAFKSDGAGGYTIVRVSDAVVPARTTALPEGVAPSVTRTADQDFMPSQERAAWGDALRSRTDQMAGRVPGESEASPAYKAREQAIREASNRIGEIGAASYVRDQFPGAELAYGGPGGAGSRTGDFDQIWRQTLPDGSLRFIVVEAKGGGADLGSSVIDGRRYSQGTPEYFDATAANMVGRAGVYGRNGAAVAEQLQDARESGRIMDGGRVREAEVVYLKAQTPVVSAAPGERQTAPTTQAQRFDLGATR